MSYKFRPAVRENAPVLLGIAGPSGSGKTFSALRLATGLAGGGKIVMIDTEARRGLHYADQFNYLYAELEAPFSPSRYMEAIKDAEKDGAAVIIIDSQSHCHEGPGGVLEMHDAELTRMAGEDWKKREACKFAAWIKPKAEHNKFVNSILQVKAHVIFCFRAKEKLKMVKNQQGKMEPVQQGWQPICTDRLEYEMTALMVLPPSSQGIPDMGEKATKLQEQHKKIFAPGRQISEEMGQEIAAWAGGGKKTGATPPPVEKATTASPETTDAADEAFAEAEVFAMQGGDAFKAWWNGGGKEKIGDTAKRELVRPRLEDLQATARDADNPEREEDPMGPGDGVAPEDVIA